MPFEFRRQHITRGGLAGFDLPAVLRKKAVQRLAREKTQVRVVQQAFGSVCELALQQFGQQAAIGHIGHRGEQLATGLEQLVALLQDDDSDVSSNAEGALNVIRGC